MAEYKSRLDRLGIVVASFCIIHCIALPIILSTLPLWDVALLENKYIETATLLIAFVVGGWAIFKGYRNFHQSFLVVLFFLTGLLAMANANFIDTKKWEMILKGMGAVLVIGAHITNWRKCKAYRLQASGKKLITFSVKK